MWKRGPKKSNARAGSLQICRARSIAGWVCPVCSSPGSRDHQPFCCLPACLPVPACPRKTSQTTAHHPPVNVAKKFAMSSTSSGTYTTFSPACCSAALWMAGLRLQGGQVRGAGRQGHTGAGVRGRGEGSTSMPCVEVGPWARVGPRSAWQTAEHSAPHTKGGGAHTSVQNVGGCSVVSWYQMPGGSRSSSLVCHHKRWQCSLHAGKGNRRTCG